MKKIVVFILICAVLFACTGCENKVQETVYAMDTVMDLQIWGADSQEGIEKVKSLLKELEDDWSTTKPDSIIGQLNRGTLSEFNPKQQWVLDEVLKLSLRTGGSFDPNLRSVVAAWGFYGQDYRVPSDDELQQALGQDQWDLGGVIKGYAGQEAVEWLQTLDIDRAILNLGGNVQTLGNKPDGSAWQIGIQNPKGGDPVGIVSVYGTAAVVTSGDYQRYFEKDGVRYHHIIDPQTGKPADSGLSSVTVICNDGMKADAFSTALFVMGLERASDFWRQSGDFEAVFILSDGTVYATEGAALSGCEYEVISREK